MNKLLIFGSSFCCLIALNAQERDDRVKKETVSIHTVERGSMSIFAPASGAIASIKPHRAILTIESSDGKCEAGKAARLVVGENPRPLAGRVVGRTDEERCEVEFTDALSLGAKLGDKVGGHIVTDELKNVVFFGRPAKSQPNSTATILVLDGDSQARRVTVRYGSMSGLLIQVIHGVVPGDRVIVTDRSKWAHLPRVRLE
jgi:hypothetical protein